MCDVCVSGNVYTGTVDGKLWRIGPDDSLTLITHMGQNLPECGLFYFTSYQNKSKQYDDNTHLSEACVCARVCVGTCRQRH